MMRRFVGAAAAVFCLWLGSGSGAVTAQSSPQRIGSVRIPLVGLSATVDPLNPVVPKNVPSGVRIAIQAGGVELPLSEAERLLGTGFEIRAELSGPGLAHTITLPQAGDPRPSDPRLLLLPALQVSGSYDLSNIRIVTSGARSLDVTPQHVTVQVIEQILVGSVTTRALTLDEINARGIVLDGDSYLGFEFTLGLLLESTPVNITFPVVFDREGVPVPQLLPPPPPPARAGVDLPPMPTIVPLLLELVAPEGEADAGKRLPITLPSGEPVRIPSVLVIPGNVGYLKQFFSAQLFVANGAPLGSGLTIRDVTGTVKLPSGPDHVLGTTDDPLALPQITRDHQIVTQPITMSVRGLGPDGQPGTADDVARLAPGEQGQTEFLLRGEHEGFHTIDFDLGATLDGLPIGPVAVTGKVSGGVLVRNPYFNMTFAAPSVVRAEEPFQLFVTVNNIGKSAANNLKVRIAEFVSGVRLASSETGEKTVSTLGPGDSKTLTFSFISEVTGAPVATYLHLDTDNGSTGTLQFKMGVGERGVALSPDTLLLPSSVDRLPASLVTPAMRVLGQAWSIANAPAGTRPAGVFDISQNIVYKKALILAEAGLRVDLGQPVADAVRDLALDLYGGSPVDPGFDQLLRETDAGHALALALGSALSPAAGPLAYERAAAGAAASGSDFISFAIGSGSNGPAPASLALTDSAGRQSVFGTSATVTPQTQVPSAVFLPLGAPASSPVLGLITDPAAANAYTLSFTASATGVVDVSATLPRGDGTLVRGWVTGVPVSAGLRGRLVVDRTQPSSLTLALDTAGDGSFATRRPLAIETLSSAGPTLVSASVVGPETFSGSSPFGYQVVALYDRVVDPTVARSTGRYQIPGNRVQWAKAQLSGRLVFLSLEQPEGPYVPTTFTTSGITDTRGSVGGTRTLPLLSRLRDPGGVVSGRLLDAEGNALSSGIVTYTNHTEATCHSDAALVQNGLSSLPVDAAGRYEFRYVRQDHCGAGFEMVTRDPATGAVSKVTARVAYAGQHLVRDLVLFGRGSVTGIVRDLQQRPLPGASVMAVSVIDPQSGGVTTTDGDGRYRISSVVVGGVTVRAAKGSGAGQASGNIGRAGTTATVDVTVDTGSVNVSGTVRKLEGGVTSPVPGALVTYRLGEGASVTVTGVTYAGADGRYAFTTMPPGSFTVNAALNTRDQASRSAISGSSGTFTQFDVLITVPELVSLGTVRGRVLLPNGSPAVNAVVGLGGSAAITDIEGRYELRGVAVQPSTTATVNAQTRDSLRTGSRTFVLGTPGQVLEGLDITLSGLASAEFTVKNAAGAPLAGQMVGLIRAANVGCADPCGCSHKTTDAAGKVRFDQLPMGVVSARAVMLSGVTDVVEGSVTLTADGQVAAGTLQFAGQGTVSGTVFDPWGQPSFGTNVELTSWHFENDGLTTCGLVRGVSARTQTDMSGRYRFQGVHGGPVSVTASQAFFPTRVGASGDIRADGQVVDLPLRLVNTIAGVLSGTVFLPDGVTPAGPGVKVIANGALPDLTVTTNEAGHYEFPKIMPEGNYSLTIKDPLTGGQSREYVYVRAGQNQVRNPRLKGRGTVLVQVLQADGQPATNGLVKLEESDFPNRRQEASLQPDGGGTVTFQNVFEGPFSIAVLDNVGRGARTAATVARPGETFQVTARLSAIGNIRGRFVKRDRVTPIPFGIVKLYPSGYGATLGQTLTLGPEAGAEAGTFAFDAVPPGPLRLEAQDPLTGRTAVWTGTLNASSTEPLEATLVAQGLGTVRGRALNLGEPVAGVDVTVRGIAFTATTQTDGSGQYYMEGVPEGPVTVSAALTHGFLSGNAAGTLYGDGNVLVVDVTLRASATVTGRVVRADGVTPAPPTKVSIWVGGDGGGGFSATTDPTGAYRFERVPAGAGTLRADLVDGSDFGNATVQVPAGGSTDSLIVLNGTGTVRVTVRDAVGQLISGASVTVGSSSVPWYWGGFSGVTDSTGVATIPRVWAGQVSVSAYNPATGRRGSASGSLAHDATLDVAVALDPFGRITGNVRRHDGAVAAGVNVLGAGRSAVTDAAGNFALENVNVGTWNLEATDASNGDRGRTSVVVAGNGTGTGTISLNGVGTATVTVRDANGAPAPGVQVSINGWGPFGGSYPATSGSDGTVTVPKVLAGPLHVHAWDHARQIGGQTEGALAPGGTVSMTITLAPIREAVGRVFLPDGQTPVAGAAVGAGWPTGAILGWRFPRPESDTAADGSYRIQNVPFTSWNVVAAWFDGRLRAWKQVTPPASGPLTVDLTLGGLGTVRGRVTRPGGAPSPDTTVTISCTGPVDGMGDQAVAPQSTVTNVDGEYLFRDQAVCAFHLNATDPVGNKAVADASLGRDGDVVTVDLPLLPSAVTLPLDLRDANQRLTTIPVDGGGPRLKVIRDGASTLFVGSGTNAGSEEGKREIVVSQSGVAGLTVTRKIYIPADGYFVRRLDSFTNPGTTPITVDIVEDASLTGACNNWWGYNCSPLTNLATSSGDGVVGAGDGWVTGGDLPLGGTHAVGVWSGAGARLESIPTWTTPDPANAWGSLLTYRWNAVVIAPGQTVTFLHMSAIQSTRDRALAVASRLGELPPEILKGMSSAEAAAIANFGVPQSLVSALPALPPIDGTITGTVRAVDASPVPYAWVYFQSLVPYYDRPINLSWQWSAGADGAFVLKPTSGPIPRGPFTLKATTHTFGERTATVTGDFPTTGTVNLAGAVGRTLKSSSLWDVSDRSSLAFAADGDPNTGLVFEYWDTTKPPYYRQPYFQVSMPSDVTVQQIRFRGWRAPVYDGTDRNFTRIQLELRDAAGIVIWSVARDLNLLNRDVDVDVPGVPGVRAVRVVGLDTLSDQPAIGDLQVYGTGLASPPGHVNQDVTFTGTGVVYARAVDSRGTPVKATFRIDGVTAPVMSDTGTDGRFPVVDVGSHTLSARAVGDTTDRVSMPITVVANQALSRDLVFSAVGRVHGAIRRANGEAPAFADVTIAAPNFQRGVRAVSSYSFADLPGGTYTVTAVAALGNQGWPGDPLHTVAPRLVKTLTVVDGQDTTLDLDFPPVGWVTVNVTSGGQPLAGAPVYWTNPSRGGAWTSAGYTDAAGRVVAPIEGPTFTVRAQQPSSTFAYGEASGTVTVERGESQIAVAVPGFGSVTGRLHGRDGAAVVNRTVHAYPVAQDTSMGSANTSGSGGFTIGSLPVGALRLRADVPGWFWTVRAEKTVTLSTAGSTLASDLLLPVGLLASGERHLWELSANAGQVVHLFLADGYNTPALTQRVAEVYGPDGVKLPVSGDDITFTAASTGRYTVVARAAALESGHYALGFGGDGIAFLIRPYEGAKMTVHLTDAANSAPLAGVKAHVRVTGAHGLVADYTAVSDASGDCRFTALPAGSYLVEAIGGGVVLAQTTGTIAATDDRSLTLPVATAVWGRISRADGTAVAGENVYVKVGVLDSAVVTDASGLYRAVSIPASTAVTVELRTPSGRTLARRTGTSGLTGTALELPLTKAGLGRLEVTTTCDGSPCAALPVNASSSNAIAEVGLLSQTASTSAGLATFAEVPVGTVTASSSAYGTPRQATGTLTEGATLSLSLVLFSDVTAPGTVGNLSATSPADGQLTLTWTAPGSDGFNGQAQAYDIRYSTSALDPSTFASASSLSAPAPLPGGQTQSFSTSFAPGAYNFALKTRDAAGNWSALSNVATVSIQSRVPAPDMLLWLAPESQVTRSGSSLRWSDLSGRGNDAIQTTAAAHPASATAAVTGLPVMRFDGVDDLLSFTTPFVATGPNPIRTVLLVVAEQAAPGTRSAWLGSSGFFAGGDGKIWFDEYWSSPQVANGRTRLNGSLVNGTTTDRPAALSVVSLTTTGNTGADRIGGYAGWGSLWKGDLAELIVYNRVLTPTELRDAEQYLLAKYRIGTVVPPPTVSPLGGLFSGSVTVTLGSRTAGAQVRYTLDGSEPTSTSALYTTPFAITSTTTVKAKAFAAGMTASTTVAQGFTSNAQFHPGQLPGNNLRLWLRADAGVAAGAGDVWLDQSPRHDDINQTYGVAAPTLVPNVVNGLPAMRFDGNDVVPFAQALATIRTVFLVVGEELPPGTRSAWLGHSNGGDFNGGDGNIWYDTYWTSPQVANGRTKVNGVAADAFTTPRRTAPSLVSVVTTGDARADRFGYNPGWGASWKGTLAELVVYDRELTDAEVRTVESYLMNKYALNTKAAAAVPSSLGGVFTGTKTITLSSATACGEIRYTLDGSDPTATSLLYTGPITIDRSLTLKTRAFCPSLPPSDVTTTGFTSDADFHPGTLPNLKMWLRADAGLADSFGNFWTDQSGQGNHGTQAQTTAVPLLVPNVGNGLPALRFDGTDWLAFTKPFTTAAPDPKPLRTVFWVVAEGLPAGTRSAWFGYNGGGDLRGGDGNIWYDAYWTSPLVANGRTKVNGTAVDPLTNARRVPLTVMSLVTTGNVRADRFGFDPGWGSVWKGDLAEVIVYDRPLSDAEVRAVEGYLLNKYGLYTKVAPAMPSAPGGVFTGTKTVTLSSLTRCAEIRYTQDGSDPTSTSLLYSGPLTISHTQTLKTRAYCPGLTPSDVTTTGFTSNADFHPGKLPGQNLRLWLRADAGLEDTFGSFWADQATPGGAATQSSTVATPWLVQNAANGLPAMRFDGVNDQIFFTGLDTIRTVFWVLKDSAPGVRSSWLGTTGGGDFRGGEAYIWYDNYWTSPKVAGGQTRLNGILAPGTSTPRSSNMSVISVVTTGETRADRFGFDPGWGSMWKGDVAEMLIYDRQLSVSEVQDIERYLGARYGIAVQ